MQCPQHKNKKLIKKGNNKYVCLECGLDILYGINKLGDWCCYQIQNTMRI